MKRIDADRVWADVERKLFAARAGGASSGRPRATS